ncbi:MAG: Heavy metal sensor histidine kinase [Nitrospira sp.]
MKSFRVQVRSSLLLLITVVLLVSNLVIYLGLQALLQKYVDGRLLGLGQTLGTLIEEQPELLLKSESALVSTPSDRLDDERNQELPEVSHSIRVLDLDGTIRWKAAGAMAGPSVPREVLEQGKAGHIAYESITTSTGTSVRRILVPVREHGDVRYLLQAEASLALADRTLKGLLGLLVASSMAMIVVAWFGSDWLARNMLGTIEALSRTAGRVSESSFHDRLKLDAPYSEFQQLAYAFNSMLDRLQKAYETERHFVDYAAHEMQTPLTILRGNLELALQKGRSAEDYREVLVSNLNQVERLIRLTKALLTLARFTSGRPPMHVGPVKLEPLLRELVEDLSLLAADRDIRLALEAESAPLVLGDELGLKQLMINLLDNALRHTDSGGLVTVRLESSGNDVTVSVQDNGHGIDPKHLPHLFDRFYRAASGTARNSEGTGLGLPIAKEIVTAHHGTITVDSELGKGSTFTVTLHRMKLLNPQPRKH